MMKPANIQPVYPLRDVSAMKLVELDPSKKGPIIVLTIEPHDNKNLFKFTGNKYAQGIIKQLANLTQILGDDFDFIAIS
jgi:hypothetical protein